MICVCAFILVWFDYWFQQVVDSSIFFFVAWTTFHKSTEFCCFPRFFFSQNRYKWVDVSLRVWGDSLNRMICGVNGVNLYNTNWRNQLKTQIYKKKTHKNSLRFESNTNHCFRIYSVDLFFAPVHFKSSSHLLYSFVWTELCTFLSSHIICLCLFIAQLLVSKRCLYSFFFFLCILCFRWVGFVLCVMRWLFVLYR